MGNSSCCGVRCKTCIPCIASAGVGAGVGAALIGRELMNVDYNTGFSSSSSSYYQPMQTQPYYYYY